MQKTPVPKGQEFRVSHPISPARRRTGLCKSVTLCGIGQTRADLLVSIRHAPERTSSRLPRPVSPSRGSLLRLRHEYSFPSQHFCRNFSHYTMHRAASQCPAALSGTLGRNSGRRCGDFFFSTERLAGAKNPRAGLARGFCLWEIILLPPLLSSLSVRRRRTSGCARNFHGVPSRPVRSFRRVLPPCRGRGWRGWRSALRP